MFRRIATLGLVVILFFLARSQIFIGDKFVVIEFSIALLFISILLSLRLADIYVPAWLYPKLEKRKVLLLAGICISACILILASNFNGNVMVVVILALVVAEDMVQRSNQSASSSEHS